MSRASTSRHPSPGFVGDVPELVRDAPAGLQDRVEVVLLHQLGPAELKHVGVDVPAGQLSPQVIGPVLGLPDGAAAVTVMTLPSSRTSSPAGDANRPAK